MSNMPQPRQRASRIGAVLLIAAALAVSAFATSCGSSNQPSQGGSSPAPSQAPEQRPEVPAQMVEIDQDTEYDDLDLTGDGQPNKLLVEVDEDKTGFVAEARVLVDDEVAMTIGGVSEDRYFFTVVAEYVVTTNSCPFLQINCIGEDDDPSISALYRYQDGGFEQVLDLIPFMSQEFGSHHCAELVKVKNNVLSIRYSMMSYILGYGFSSTFEYAVDDQGNLSLVSDQVDNITYIANMKECDQDSDEFLTLDQDVQAYDKPGETGEATDLKTGTKLAPKGTCVKDGDVFVKFQDKKGKDLWIHATPMPEIRDDGTMKTLFKDVMYAG